MTTFIRLFSVIWSLFWRACVYGLPMLVIFIVALAALIVPPFLAVTCFWSGFWGLGGLIVAGWLAFLALGGFLVRRMTYKPVDRYSNGAI